MTNDPACPGSVTCVLSSQVRAMVRNQVTLMTMVQKLTDHVLKLQLERDPLTWKRRALLTFAGSFAGGAIVLLLLRVGELLTAGR